MHSVTLFWKLDMFFDKKKYQLDVGKLVSPVPQFGDGSFTVNCFVYLEGEKAGSRKLRDGNDRSRLHLELELQELDGKHEYKAASASRHPVFKPIDSLEGLTSRSGLESETLDSGGLRFDLDGLHILPKIDKGTFRIHAKLSRAHFSLRGGSEYELLAEADSEIFTRGDMTKHRLPDGWEIFQGSGGFR